MWIKDKCTATIEETEIEKVFMIETNIKSLTNQRELFDENFWNMLLSNSMFSAFVSYCACGIKSPFMKQRTHCFQAAIQDGFYEELWASCLQISSALIKRARFDAQRFSTSVQARSSKQSPLFPPVKMCLPTSFGSSNVIQTRNRLTLSVN